MKPFIEFPQLGWKFEISEILFSFELFGHEFTIRWYGVIIALGFLLAIIYGLKRAKYFGVDPDRMIDVVLVCAIFAFVGARLYYVLFSPDRASYFEDPIKILRIIDGGLGIYGGIIMAFLTALWMCKVRKVNTLAMFDLASLGFLIGQGIGRWGNFFNQEAFGGNTTLPWGMTGSEIMTGMIGTGYDPKGLVHPTFLYESLWCLLGLVLLHIVSKKFYKFKGQIFSMYLIWYGAGRFAIESLRTDSLVLGTMKISQVVAIMAILLGIILLFVLKGYENRLPKTLQDDGEATIALAEVDGIELLDTDDGEAGTDGDEESAQAEDELSESSETPPEEDDAYTDNADVSGDASDETAEEPADTADDNPQG